MQTVVINQTHKHAIIKAHSILTAGGVIAIPTDTVYGIACMINNPSGIKRLYSIKERDLLKAIPVLIGSIAQAQMITQDFSDSAKILAHHLWPGALTLVVNKHQNLPAILSTYPTVGVRMPDHNWLRKLMDVSGPLAVTSANISGKPSLASADQVLESLGGKIDLLIEGGTCKEGIPSTVVDCTMTPVNILRSGNITKESIQYLIENN
jgi:L-threonylcarbamoyladenylate synthase